ncbi:hypothetical protein HGP14_34440 [Rhizobium sp. P32RR-XVIII]|nr:hypothetical protein [Rhizobium sp. P32RR-XVIII]
MREVDFKILSQAVQGWYRHYGVPFNDESTEVLCSAAIDLYNGGHKTVGEITPRLIQAYHGLMSMKVNSPTSIAIH